MICGFNALHGVALEKTRGVVKAVAEGLWRRASIATGSSRDSISVPHAAMLMKVMDWMFPGEDWGARAHNVLRKLGPANLKEGMFGAPSLLLTAQFLADSPEQYMLLRKQLRQIVQKQINDQAEALTLPLTGYESFDLITGLSGYVVTLGGMGLDFREAANKLSSTFAANEGLLRVVHPRLKCDVLDLGVAHGLAGVLLALVRLLPGNSTAETTLVDILMRYARQENGVAKFPSMVAGEYAQWSRSAWCYGTVGVAYVLLEIGLNKGRPDLAALALQTLINEASIAANITDLSLCHGAAGIALVFAAAGRIGTEPQLTESARRLALHVVDFYNADLPLGYAAQNAAPEEDSSFLLGATGIALALTAFCGEIRCDWIQMLGLR